MNIPEVTRLLKISSSKFAQYLGRQHSIQTHYASSPVPTSVADTCLEVTRMMPLIDFDDTDANVDLGRLKGLYLEEDLAGVLTGVISISDALQYKRGAGSQFSDLQISRLAQSDRAGDQQTKVVATHEVIGATSHFLVNKEN